MIPGFPKFKKLELSDREEVQTFTKQFPPYSDYNFTSMWCWDIKEEIKLSKFNGNLVVRFNDYLTGEPFYSFLGINNVTETALILLKQSKEEALGDYLKLIPEVTAEKIDKNVLIVEEDRDNFDYIYSIAELSLCRGKKYETLRNQINRYSKKYPENKIIILNLGEDLVKKDLERINNVWVKNKGKEEKEERVAISRLFNYVKSFNLLCIGIIDQSNLIGYNISEIIDKNFVITHFSKADITYNGIYYLLLKKLCDILLAKDYKFLNYEQDLGISNLRYSKESHRPKYFLKKYILKD